jgi:hypothetical protein
MQELLGFLSSPKSLSGDFLGYLLPDLQEKAFIFYPSVKKRANFPKGRP